MILDFNQILIKISKIVRLQQIILGIFFLNILLDKCVSTAELDFLQIQFVFVCKIFT